MSKTFAIKANYYEKITFDLNLKEKIINIS